jgi:hypothetical protein
MRAHTVMIAQVLSVVGSAWLAGCGSVVLGGAGGVGEVDAGPDDGGGGAASGGSGGAGGSGGLPAGPLCELDGFRICGGPLDCPCEHDCSNVIEWPEIEGPIGVCKTPELVAYTESHPGAFGEPARDGDVRVEYPHECGPTEPCQDPERSCLSFTVDAENQSLADAHGFCMLHEDCLGLAATLPGGGVCQP